MVRGGKHMVHSLQQLSQIKNDMSKTITRYQLLSPRTLYVTTKDIRGRVHPNVHGCIYISAIVTSMARIYLTNTLEKALRHDLYPVYMDTGNKSIVKLL